MKKVTHQISFSVLKSDHHNSVNIVTDRLRPFQDPQFGIWIFCRCCGICKVRKRGTCGFGHAGASATRIEALRIRFRFYCQKENVRIVATWLIPTYSMTWGRWVGTLSGYIRRVILEDRIQQSNSINDLAVAILTQLFNWISIARYAVGTE